MPQLTPELIAAFRRLDTCSVSNAIETFDCRLRNEGFAGATLHCLFDDLPPVVGHAVTARIHCSSPPPVGHTYPDRTDWWNYILTVPPPRIIVVEDADPYPGTGAFVGEVHASILQALGCVACVTSGSIRDLTAIHAVGFQCFAASVAVSHAYAHIVDFGGRVTVDGLGLESGEVVYGDRHGLLSIPETLIAQIPDVADRLNAGEQNILRLCRSNGFSLDRLRALVEHIE
jgi:4-hydroxy-4-methyl-2-oxoglutarate aldolase